MTFFGYVPPHAAPGLVKAAFPHSFAHRIPTPTADTCVFFRGIPPKNLAGDTYGQVSNLLPDKFLLGWMTWRSFLADTWRVTWRVKNSARQFPIPLVRPVQVGKLICCGQKGISEYPHTNMAFTDILSLILSFAVVFSVRFLFPKNIVPRVSTSFEEALILLERAEAVNIPYVSEYRTNLALLRPQFLQMRTDSHRSPGFLEQVYLLFLCGLTWRLFVLKSRVDGIRRRIELAVDARQLSFPFLTDTNAQSATTTALPASAADTVVINVTEPTPPPQAILSVRPVF